MSCMLACSLVNEGVENPSLSRIQVIQNHSISLRRSACFLLMSSISFFI
jgi:hypothetical protein